jgi:hypothetical protein
MVRWGRSPTGEEALGPGPSLGRVGDGAQQRAGVQPVHPSGPLAGVRRRFSVNQRVASGAVSTSLGCWATGCLAPPLENAPSEQGPVLDRRARSERAARWRFAAGCAWAAIFPPGGTRAAVGVAGVLAVTATAAAAGATGAALPAGRVFVPVFVGLLGGLAALAVARSRRAGHAGPGPAVAGLGLAGVAACVAFLGYYLAEFPTYHRARLQAWTLVSLPPVTAVVLAVVLDGCLWLALRPPRWLLGDRHALGASASAWPSPWWPASY